MMKYLIGWMFGAIGSMAVAVPGAFAQGETPDRALDMAPDMGWYDPVIARERIATAPAIDVGIRPVANASLADTPAEPSRADWIDWTIAVASIALLALIGWLVSRATHAARAWKAARQRAHASSEAARFDALLRALRCDDALETYRALHAWTRSAHGCGLAAWCIDVNDAELSQQVTLLERMLFTKSRPMPRWRGIALTRALQRVRRVAPRRTRSRSTLPPLNPPTHDLHE